MLTGQQFAEKWARRTKASGADVRLGVDGVTVAPGVKAAAKAQKMLEGIQRAIADGTWQRAVAAVPLEEWKKQMIDKGIPRIAAGVDSAAAHMAQMGEKLMGAIATVKTQVDKMPDTTFEDRIQKMVAFTTAMHKVKLR